MKLKLKVFINFDPLVSFTYLSFSTKVRVRFRVSKGVDSFSDLGGRGGGTDGCSVRSIICPLGLKRVN